jgi:hypothetical protein
MSLFNDGTYQVGSRTLSLNSVTYIAESFSYEEPTAKVEDVTDSVGDASGSVAWAGIPNGSATLQMSGSMAIPTQGQAFTSTIRGVSTSFKVLTVSTPEEAQGRKKVNITFKKTLN